MPPRMPDRLRDTRNRSPLMRWAAYFPAILEGPLPDPAAEPPVLLANDPAWLRSRAAARHRAWRSRCRRNGSSNRRTERIPRPDRARYRVRLQHSAGATLRLHARARTPATAARPIRNQHSSRCTYVQYADGDVAGALASVREALVSEPRNAIAWARRAELELWARRFRGKLSSRARIHAIDLEPSLGLAHSVLGLSSALRARVEPIHENSDPPIRSVPSAGERLLDQGAPVPRARPRAGVDAARQTSSPAAARTSR
jgi:hypothetical protein